MAMQYIGTGTPRQTRSGTPMQMEADKAPNPDRHDLHALATCAFPSFVPRSRAWALHSTAWLDFSAAPGRSTSGPHQVKPPPTPTFLARPDAGMPFLLCGEESCVSCQAHRFQSPYARARLSDGPDCAFLAPNTLVWDTLRALRCVRRDSDRLTD